MVERGWGGLEVGKIWQFQTAVRMGSCFTVMEKRRARSRGQSLAGNRLLITPNPSRASGKISKQGKSRRSSECRGRRQNTLPGTGGTHVCGAGIRWAAIAALCQSFDCAMITANRGKSPEQMGLAGLTCLPRHSKLVRNTVQTTVSQIERSVVAVAFYSIVYLTLYAYTSAG